MRLGRPLGWRLFSGFSVTVGVIMVADAGAYFALTPNCREASAGREQLSLLTTVWSLHLLIRLRLWLWRYLQGRRPRCRSRLWQRIR